MTVPNLICEIVSIFNDLLITHIFMICSHKCYLQHKFPNSGNIMIKVKQSYLTEHIFIRFKNFISEKDGYEFFQLTYFIPCIFIYFQ